MDGGGSFSDAFSRSTVTGTLSSGAPSCFQVGASRIGGAEKLNSPESVGLPSIRSPNAAKPAPASTVVRGLTLPRRRTTSADDRGWIIGTAVQPHLMDIRAVRVLRLRSFCHGARRHGERSAGDCDCKCKRNADGPRVHGATPSFHRLRRPAPALVMLGGSMGPMLRLPPCRAHFCDRCLKRKSVLIWINAAQRRAQ